MASLELDSGYTDCQLPLASLDWKGFTFTQSRNNSHDHVQTTAKTQAFQFQGKLRWQGRTEDGVAQLMVKEVALGSERNQQKLGKRSGKKWASVAQAVEKTKNAMSMIM